MASQKQWDGEYGSGSPLRSLSELEEAIADRPGGENSFETLALELLLHIAKNLDRVDTRQAEAVDEPDPFGLTRIARRPQGAPRYE